MKCLAPLFAIAGLLLVSSSTYAEELDAAAGEMISGFAGRGNGVALLVPCCDCCCDSCCGWYGMKEMLFWNRNNNSGRVAAIRVTDEGNALPGTTVLTTSDPNFTAQPGMRPARWLAARCVSGRGILVLWHPQLARHGDGQRHQQPCHPGDLGLASLDFFAADQMTAQLPLAAQQRRSEPGANVRRLVAPRRFPLSFARRRFQSASTDLDTGTSNYRIHSSNNLFGGQVGTRYKQYWDRFGLGRDGQDWHFWQRGQPIAIRHRFSTGLFPPRPHGRLQRATWLSLATSTSRASIN